MPKVLTNGKTKIGAYKFTDRKKVALCIEKENSSTVYGYFQSADGADEFMNELGKLIGCEVEND